MSFIDWSDSEGMMELLSEFVRDEINECGKDPKRKAFLSALLVRLHDLEARSETAKQTADQLRKIHNSIPEEFEDDPASIHINDCILELDRLQL